MLHVWNGSGWGVLWMVLSMAVFWGALAALVVALLRGSDKPGKTPEPDANEMLRRRFASGEISKEEFEERLGVLSVPQR